MNLFEYTYNLVRQIPDGYVSSYGAVADALGDKIAARAVGRMMNQNPNADAMPCYKIVYSNGNLGGFGLGLEDKIKRLNKVNVQVEKNKIQDFESVFFNNFKTEYPLKKLRNEQIKLSKKVNLNNGFKKIETVAGIDISYPKNEFEQACGACIVMDYKTKKIIEKKTIFWETNFPYISTYFFYREYPIIWELINILKTEPTVFIFDGNGILHPYGIGLATQVGIRIKKPTIGIAKRLLYGDIKGNYVYVNGIKKGFIYFSTEKIKRPIFVSPGNKISFETTKKIVSDLSIYKIPEPLRKAHILSKKKLKS